MNFNIKNTQKYLDYKFFCIFAPRTVVILFFSFCIYDVKLSK